MKNYVLTPALLIATLGTTLLATFGFSEKATAQKALIKALMADQYSAIFDPGSSLFLTYGDYGFDLGYYSSQYLTRQQWSIKDGYIKLKQSGEFLTANTSGVPYLSKYQQGNNAQKWEVKKVRNGKSYIRSLSTGRYLGLQKKKVALMDLPFYFEVINARPVKEIKIYATGDPVLMSKVSVHLETVLDGAPFKVSNNKFNGKLCKVEIPYDPDSSVSWRITITEPEPKSLGKMDCNDCYSKSQNIVISARTDEFNFREPIQR